MSGVQTALMIIRGISTLAVNPALGGGGIGPKRTAALLDMFATIVAGGEEMHQEFDKLAAEIQAMVDNGGNPTKGQWEAMAARDLAARQTLLENAKALEESQAPKPSDGPDVSGLGGTQNPSDGTGGNPPATGGGENTPTS